MIAFTLFDPEIKNLNLSVKFGIALYQLVRDIASKTKTKALCYIAGY